MTDSALLSRAKSEDAASSKEDSVKRRQIVDGAREVFLQSGFDGASMNEIARVAGVSKGTLYVYFDSKEDLFEALIIEDKREQAEQLCRFEEDGSDIRLALVHFGFRLLDRMLRPTSIAHLRTVAAVSAKFPRIGRAYYEAGPQLGMQRLAAYLGKHVESGTIQVDNLESAAMHFIEMCKSYHLIRGLFNVCDRPPDAVLRAHVDSAVDAFLRAYARRNAEDSCSPLRA